MRIDAAKAERADRASARMFLRAVASRPRTQRIDHFQAECVEVDMRIRFCVVQAGRYLAMFDCENELDQAGDTGGCFEVADIGLDRTDQQRRRSP